MHKKIPLLFGFALTTALSGLALAHPCGGPDGRRGGGFGRADLNNDGKVTLDEAIAHGKQRFQEMDKNKDGAVTKDELPGRGRFFDQADANKDGKVTYAEHEAMLKKRFADRDTNKDGVLTGDEIRRGPGRGPR
jgi:Ca2+-binding EF-hand superfamily protein